MNVAAPRAAEPRREEPWNRQARPINNALQGVTISFFFERACSLSEIYRNSIQLLNCGWWRAWWRARVLAEEDAEEGAQGGRHCGRSAWNPMLSAHLRIALDLSYKDHPSAPVSASPGRCARGCTGECLQLDLWRSQLQSKSTSLRLSLAAEQSDAHRQHSPARPPARPHTMVRSEMPFLSAPSCAAIAPAPLSARVRCTHA